MRILIVDTVLCTAHESWTIKGAIQLTNLLLLFTMLSDALRLIDTLNEAWNLVCTSCLGHTSPLAERAPDWLVIDSIFLFVVHNRAKVAVLQGRATFTTRTQGACQIILQLDWAINGTSLLVAIGSKLTLWDRSRRLRAHWGLMPWQIWNIKSVSRCLTLVVEDRVETFEESHALSLICTSVQVFSVITNFNLVSCSSIEETSLELVLTRCDYLVSIWLTVAALHRGCLEAVHNSFTSARNVW